MKTTEQFDIVAGKCRRIYELKMKDYGPSWRIMRPQTVNDQLFIKAKRVREIEQTGVNMVGESIEGEMMAIVNYSIIGLIQLFEGYADSVDMTAERAIDLYDHYMAEAKALMLKKNHDYGDSFSKTFDALGIISAVTRISDKYNRLCSLAMANGQHEVKDESIEDTLLDMANYCIMTYMELKEREQN